MNHIDSFGLRIPVFLVAAILVPLPAYAAEPAPTDRQSLKDAALARRIEEYSDSKKGEARAAEDRQALAATERFVEALIKADAPSMLLASSLPWIYHAELSRDREALQSRLAELRVPAVFAKGEPRVALIGSLEELELAMGKRVPEGVRKAWMEHLKDSRVGVVQRGPMLLAFSVRRADAKFHVSGMLFDFFPKPGDPLVRLVGWWTQRSKPS